MLFYKTNYLVINKQLLLLTELIILAYNMVAFLGKNDGKEQIYLLSQKPKKRFLIIIQSISVSINIDVILPIFEVI